MLTFGSGHCWYIRLHSRPDVNINPGTGPIQIPSPLPTLLTDWSKGGVTHCSAAPDSAFECRPAAHCYVISPVSQKNGCRHFRIVFFMNFILSKFRRAGQPS